jgi:hypothetical protein
METEMSKSFSDMVRKNPDSFDEMDCRPGPSAYPKENEEASLPEFISGLLSKKKKTPNTRNAKR